MSGADVLSDIVALVRMQGEMSHLLSLRGDVTWAGEPSGLRLYLVHSGSLRLHGLATHPCLDLATGDLLLLSDPPPHALSTLADQNIAYVEPDAADPNAQGWTCVGARNQPELARLLVGHMRIDDSIGSSLLRALPRVLHVARKQDSHEVLRWLDTAAHFLALEIVSPSVGSSVMVSRLLDLLFVQAARHWARQSRAHTDGWLWALRDPGIAAALLAMHQQPARAWTVQALAARANLSRSLFATRFLASIGMSPIRYLRQWRIQLAKRALRDTRRSVAQIAESVGYESESAFIKAFVKESGHTPRRHREQLAETSGRDAAG